MRSTAENTLVMNANEYSIYLVHMAKKRRFSAHAVRVSGLSWFGTPMSSANPNILINQTPAPAVRVQASLPDPCRQCLG